jgi:predicted transcriptional regulator of viral defense system
MNGIEDFLIASEHTSLAIKQDKNTYSCPFYRYKLLFLTKISDKMRYLEFQNAFKQFPVISRGDIEKVFPGYDARRLTEWQEKGYITKVRNGLYTFADTPVDEAMLFYISNRAHVPSYVSLESALSNYSLIPEAVFTTTAVSTQNTAAYATPLGHFQYRHIKASLFFGYKLIRTPLCTFKIAEPEKALLDYLYFNPLNSEEDMEALRLNPSETHALLESSRMKNYLTLFKSPTLRKRIRLLKKLMPA